MKLLREFLNIQYTCYVYRKKLDKARRFLGTIDANIIRLYVQHHRLSVRLSIGYCEYYDREILKITDKNERLREMIIAHLCIIPFHPEYKKTRYERVLENSFFDGSFIAQ